MKISEREKVRRPFISKEDEKQFIKVMLGLGKKYLDVLEWGSGYSTRYFPSILRNEGINYTWDAIEYSERWYNKVKKWNVPGVNLFLFKEENVHNLKLLKKKSMTEFVNFPIGRGRKYDLIFVDGRKRVKCLEVAKDFLKEDGFVLLHDAWRKEYQQSLVMSKYYDGQFLTYNLWKGKPKI